MSNNNETTNMTKAEANLFRRIAKAAELESQKVALDAARATETGAQPIRADVKVSEIARADILTTIDKAKADARLEIMKTGLKAGSSILNNSISSKAGSSILNNSISSEAFNISQERLDEIMKRDHPTGSNGIVMTKRMFLASQLMRYKAGTTFGTGIMKALLAEKGYKNEHNPEMLKLAEKLVEDGVITHRGYNSMGHHVWAVFKSTYVEPTPVEETKVE